MSAGENKERSCPGRRSVTASVPSDRPAHQGRRTSASSSRVAATASNARTRRRLTFACDLQAQPGVDSLRQPGGRLPVGGQREAQVVLVPRQRFGMIPAGRALCQVGVERGPHVGRGFPVQVRGEERGGLLAVHDSPSRAAEPLAQHGPRLRQAQVDPIFLRWAPSHALTATPGNKATHPNERLQRFSPKKRRQYPLRRGLSPAHQMLLLGSAREIGLHGAPRTPGDGLRTRLSGRPTSTRGTGQPQPFNAVQDRGEQLARHRHLRQLEDDVLGVGYHLGPDLDQLLS